MNAFSNIKNNLALSLAGKHSSLNLNHGHLEYKEPKTLDDCVSLASSVIGIGVLMMGIKSSMEFVNKTGVYDPLKRTSRVRYLNKMNKERLKRISMYKKPTSKKAALKRSFSIEKIKGVKC